MTIDLSVGAAKELLAGTAAIRNRLYMQHPLHLCIRFGILM